MVNAAWRRVSIGASHRRARPRKTCGRQPRHFNAILTANQRQFNGNLTAITRALMHIFSRFHPDLRRISWFEKLVCLRNQLVQWRVTVRWGWG